jgi:multidrug efflux pump subunit AcrB
MGLVQYALKFRVSFYVLAVVMLLGGIGSAIVGTKDVLPTVNIPVVVIVWTYTGLDTTDMASRITTYSEFSLSNNVNNIRRMESQTLPGVAIEKVYFDNSVSIDLAITQVVSSANSIRALMACSPRSCCASPPLRCPSSSWPCHRRPRRSPSSMITVSTASDRP